ncbi:MAG: alpha/beta hydrolase [Acidimicrobiales bacterium]
MPRLQVNGVGLEYKVQGDGEPVLLICGTGQQASTWDIFLAPALVQAGYQVVTYDNRGMPPSECPPGPYSVSLMAEDTAGLIEGIGIAPCPVAGLSLGAFTTQELALARPDLVRAGVMMGTLGRLDTFRKALFNAWVELDQTGFEMPTRYEAVNGAFDLFSHHALDDDEAIGFYLEMTQMAPSWSGPGRIGQHMADASYDDRLAALSGVQVPTMVLGFERDMVTPVKLSKEVAQSIPGCKYVEIPGIGHGGPFENAEAVDSAVIEFLRTV